MIVLLVLSSALLMALAQPNEFIALGVPVLGLVALAPAILAIDRARSPGVAVRLGALFGVVSTVLGNYWLAFFGDFSAWTIGGAALGYAAYNALLFGILHALWHGDGFIIASRVLRLAIAWTGYEYFKSVGFLGYPWGLIGYPIAWWLPVAQVAELAGVWPLSFLAAFANATVASLAAPRRRAATPDHTLGPAPVVGPGRVSKSPRLNLRLVVATVALFAVAAGYGLVRLPHIEPTRELQVLLVQQNVDSWQPGRFDDALATAQRLTLDALAKPEAGEVALVVWSETALRRPFTGPRDEYFSQQPAQLPFTEFLSRVGRPLITGAPLQAPDSPGDYTNSALVLAPDGQILGSYAKRQLVPFAERIPGWDLPFVRSFFQNVIGLYGSWVPGDSAATVTIPIERPGVPSVTVGLPICFEDAFGWVPRDLKRNGAELMVNLTNNSWSRQVSAQTQHLAAARLRTIELRQALVRGTNSGISGVVDARGEVVATLPMFESTTQIVSVPLYEAITTPYTVIGDLMGAIMAWGTVAGVAVWGWRRRSVAALRAAATP